MCLVALYISMKFEYPRNLTIFQEDSSVKSEFKIRFQKMVDQ